MIGFMSRVASSVVAVGINVDGFLITIKSATFELVHCDIPVSLLRVLLRGPNSFHFQCGIFDGMLSSGIVYISPFCHRWRVPRRDST